MLKIFLLVLLLLWLVFLIAPKSAHVAYEADAISELSEITATQINTKIATKYVIFEDAWSLFIFDAKGFSLNGQYYQNPEETEDPLTWMSPAQMIWIGKSQVSIHGEKFEPFEINSTSYTSEYNDTEITNPTSNLIRFSKYSDEYMVKAQITNITINENIAILIPNNQETYIVWEDEKIPIIDKWIYVYKKERTDISLSFSGLEDIQFWFHEPIGRIELCNVNSISFKSHGELDFSYSPNSIHYALRNQKILLESKDTLYAEIVLGRGIENISINGIVHNATISDMSLFPSFWGWYRDNIYLIPLTLLSTIFGGVAIMINKRKKSQ
ncbi:MAG: hypothetical protein FWF10_02615 [Clostridiales bacterium]|nr:hypothetical protein [Clostridiales bacterium]